MLIYTADQLETRVRRAGNVLAHHVARAPGGPWGPVTGNARTIRMGVELRGVRRMARLAAVQIKGDFDEFMRENYHVSVNAIAGDIYEICLNLLEDQGFNMG